MPRQRAQSQGQYETIVLVYATLGFFLGFVAQLTPEIKWFYAGIIGLVMFYGWCEILVAWLDRLQGKQHRLATLQPYLLGMTTFVVLFIPRYSGI